MLCLLMAADLIVVGSGRPMNTSDVRKEPGVTRQHIDGSPETLFRLHQLTSGVPPSRYDTHKSSVMFSMTAPLTQLVTANGYNPMVLERLIQARLAFASGYRWGAWYEVEDPSSPVIDAMNIRYLLSGTKISGSGNVPERYSLAATLPDFFVYENRSVLPRMWMVHQVDWVRSPTEALDRMRRAEFQPARAAVVEGNTFGVTGS
jgi:hypothetical protein